eukprot:NODE_3969_length_856_cov_18.156134_g3293_i0.p1 GENE.NODE_3969_length_856_cov_18.156134_g3293_i0~~NODE_3969_length_856_cov_18.156134_g3293_i0.p1  ORF type:complete len:224 (-),score=28.58 NODE_3969_length_856_cov_18.156134_g3293_i0:49-720(-)
MAGAEEGLDTLFRVAGEEREVPFHGLSLLSQLCSEEGLTNHSIPEGPLPPALTKRVGLRLPVNEPRTHIVVLEDVRSFSPRTLYEHYCDKFQLHPNSGILNMLPTEPGVFDLKILDLSGNLVGEKGLLPIIEVIRVLPQLTHLVLPENGLRNEGVECLVHSAISHPALRSIDLSGNRLTIGSGKVLEYLVRKNKRIQELKLSGTRIEPNQIQKINTLLRSNRG